LLPESETIHRLAGIMSGKVGSIPLCFFITRTPVLDRKPPKHYAGLGRLGWMQLVPFLTA